VPSVANGAETHAQTPGKRPGNEKPPPVASEKWTPEDQQGAGGASPLR
jgi:hypothetical protein